MVCARLTVCPPPTGLSRFQQGPEAQVVPVGGAARFECQVQGVPMPLITWEKDQAPIPSEPR